MVSTKKFSEFTSGGDLSNDKTTVGLGVGGNTRYNNPWTFLADGTTGDRPAIDPSMYYRLRFNTQTITYEYYDPLTEMWIELEDTQSILPLLESHLAGEGASLIGLQDQSFVTNKTVQDLANSGLISQTNNGTLINGQFLADLATGIVKNATVTGALSVLTGSSLITAIINDDTMATAANTNLPTALSVKNYVDNVSGSGTVSPGVQNEIAYYPANGNTVDGLPGEVSSMLVTDETGSPSMVPSLEDGEIVIGATGAIPAKSTLTAGSGISITNGPNSITIENTSTGLSWTEVTGTSQAMVADNGYVANNVGLVTLTLPSTAAFGTIISLIGKGSGGWKIAQNASQLIRIGNVVSTTGTGGSVSSTNQYDSLQLVCTTADTTWTILGGAQSSGLIIV